jgi:hypothetical protein
MSAFVRASHRCLRATTVATGARVVTARRFSKIDDDVDDARFDVSPPWSTQKSAIIVGASAVAAAGIGYGIWRWKFAPPETASLTCPVSENLKAASSSGSSSPAALPPKTPS